MSSYSNSAQWRGEELFETPEWQLELTEAEVYELLATAGAAVMAGESLTLDRPCPGLPLLGPKLRYIQDRLENGTGAIRLRGFPPAVPLETARQAFWILSRHLGTPVSQSASGERLLSVRDAGYQATDTRARGPNTRKQLSFHTDRCDVIGFLCHRQALAGGENQVVSSVSLYHRMQQECPELVKVLQEPFLYQRHNVDTGNDLPFCEQPIFSVQHGKFAANLLRVLIERAYALPETPDMLPQQRAALDELERLAEDPCMHATFRQQAGDMLFLNNFVTFHRRQAFQDANDPADKRHLLRVWLAVPNSRELDPRFAANYGSTAAGSVRGGMLPQN